MNNKKIAQTTIVVTIILLGSKISGFFRDAALAYTYGTSVKSDAFVLAISAVGVFAMIFASIGIGYMPIYKLLVVKMERRDCKKFADTVYSVLGVFSVTISIIGILFAETLVTILAPGFNQSANNIAVTITKIMMVSILFSYLVNIASQQLRAENSFFMASAMGIPANFVLIFSFIFIAPVFDIQGVALGNVLGIMLQAIILFVLLHRTGYKYNFQFDLNNKGLKQICILTLPILLGNAVQAINTIVDRMLASGLAEGSMAALNFSNKLAVFVISIISLGAGNVCYTKMSELGAEGKNKELANFLRSVINLLNIIVVPATVGMTVLSVPIIQTVFEYGAFDSSSSQLTATALYFYALGLVGYSLRDMITRAFYSLQDSKTPMINGITSVAVNIILNLVLVRVMGIGGLALATSISAVFGTFLLLISLRKKLGAIGGREMCATFVKCVVAASVMGICVKYVYVWTLSMVAFVPIALFISIALGMAVYGTCTFFMNIKEVEIIKYYITKKVIHRKESQ